MKAEPSRLATKSFATMPDEVRASALCASPGLAGRSFRLAQDLITPILEVALWCARLVPLIWLLQLVPSNDSQLVPGTRIASAVYLATLLLAAVGYRLFFDLKGCVPRQDPEYPLIGLGSSIPGWLSRYEDRLPLSWICLAYSGLLWLSWRYDWQSVPSARHTLGFAVLNTTIGVAAWWYGQRLPFHGYRPPSQEEFDAYVRRRTQQEMGSQAHTAPQAQDYATPVQARPPRLTFADIHGMAALKRQMLAAATEILQARGAGEPPRNGILLHGEPGNGKTVFAEALAGELGVPLVSFAYGDVSSKWIGEMPRLLANCFAYARQNAPCLLFIDEIDSFIRSRDGAAVSEDLKVANTILTEVVALRAHQVVLVAATNYLGMLDAAATREGRFDFKVEVTPPDEQARIGLLREGIRRHLPGVVVDEAAMVAIARRWGGFSVSRIMAVARAMADHLQAAEGKFVGYGDWQAALRLVQGRKGQVPASAKRLRDLYLEPATREALAGISHRLRDAHRVEALGGTLPGGVLLSGPPGTGKTVAAQALALESGWAFLPVTGADLVSDRERMARIHKEACDLRPALVFIDEADDVLRNRSMSMASDVVNRLLALMDGSGAKIPDVVYLAATNHPDQVDPALLRAGRFTEKIYFHPPPPEQIVRALRAWLRSKEARLEGVNAAEVADMLAGATMADLQGVMQHALNRAITSVAATNHAVIRRADVEAAVRTVLA